MAVTSAGPYASLHLAPAAQPTVSKHLRQADLYNGRKTGGLVGWF